MLAPGSGEEGVTRMRLCTSVFAAASLVLAAPVGAKVLTVSPGQSIQAAVDQAQPGDTVKVQPGTYHEAGTPCPTDATHTCAVVVTQPNVALVGARSFKKKVVLENPGGQDQGI